MYDTTSKPANTWIANPPSKVHDEASKPGKFDDGFMGQGVDDDKPTPKSTQPTGSYPLSSGSEGSFAKPVQPTNDTLKYK